MTSSKSIQIPASIGKRIRGLVEATERSYIAHQNDKNTLTQVLETTAEALSIPDSYKLNTATYETFDPPAAGESEGE